MIVLLFLQHAAGTLLSAAGCSPESLHGGPFTDRFLLTLDNAQANSAAPALRLLTSAANRSGAHEPSDWPAYSVTVQLTDAALDGLRPFATFAHQLGDASHSATDVVFRASPAAAMSMLANRSSVALYVDVALRTDAHGCYGIDGDGLIVEMSVGATTAFCGHHQPAACARPPAQEQAKEQRSLNSMLFFVLVFFVVGLAVVGLVSAYHERRRPSPSRRLY